jgi:SAM-dependent methyltransferase
MSQEIPKHTFFWEGIFPKVASTVGFPKQADLILVYSVLHYTDEPEVFVDQAVSLLAEGGQLLLGDLPNVHKKGRFLTSSPGRQFEATYRGVNQADLPVYKDQFDYYDKCDNQNKKINDDLIVRIINKYRGKGYDVYVLPQSKYLPFSYTREDLLICRH